MQLKRSPGQKTEVALKIELDIASVVEVYQVKDNKQLRLNGSNKSRKIQQHKFTLIGKAHAPFRNSCTSNSFAKVDDTCRKWKPVFAREMCKYVWFALTFTV